MVLNGLRFKNIGWQVTINGVEVSINDTHLCLYEQRDNNFSESKGIRGEILRPPASSVSQTILQRNGGYFV
jgi:hypothetical protein